MCTPSPLASSNSGAKTKREGTLALSNTERNAASAAARPYAHGGTSPVMVHAPVTQRPAPIAPPTLANVKPEPVDDAPTNVKLEPVPDARNGSQASPLSQPTPMNVASGEALTNSLERPVNDERNGAHRPVRSTRGSVPTYMLKGVKSWVQKPRKARKAPVVQPAVTGRARPSGSSIPVKNCQFFPASTPWDMLT
ncbi:hypothetical protein FRC10_007012 [Ceratobasidium sp. 414]|nr:hypothetical protein FRC10_007012 [Ceratobasidium sp. 414]